MKWLLVCDPALPIDDYGEVLSEAPPGTETAGCPEGSRAVYLQASLEQVRPLTAGNERVYRLLPVWERPALSPAELLVLERRVEAAQEEDRRRGEKGPQ